LLFLFTVRALAQFPGPAGQSGSTAIHEDSSVFIGWAVHCVVLRGYVDIADTSLGYTTAGGDHAAIGKPSENGTVSLGDGGEAVLEFEPPIANSTGFDFAVFENALNDSFLELAYVEVSSNGTDFFRFPAISLTDTGTQVPTFGSIDATKINNLAGKYRMDYGTPFDLDDIPDNDLLDKNNVRYVKVIDVVGSINPAYARYDSEGRIINDPYPTPFPTGGFDLSGVGVINSVSSIAEKPENHSPKITYFPETKSISIKLEGKARYRVCTILGQIISTGYFFDSTEINMQKQSGKLIVVHVDTLNTVQCKTKKIVIW